MSLLRVLKGGLNGGKIFLGGGMGGGGLIDEYVCEREGGGREVGYRGRVWFGVGNGGGGGGIGVGG